MTQVALQVIALNEAPILANLLELYSHDLSPYFALQIGADGRFGYRYLPKYWEEPERRFAFFIMADAQLAGFALATLDSSPSDAQKRLDVAEFFVLRARRVHGIGARAACLLWERLPGHWSVRVATENRDAVLFWRRTISHYTDENYAEGALQQGDIARQRFTFVSPRQAALDA
jgi:predicted acetyltransferase